MDEPLETRRKRLLYRSRHRGMQELDLLIGRFAEQHLPDFDEDQLARFEALLEVPEPMIYDWLLRRAAPPAHLNHDVLQLLLEFPYRRRRP